MASRQWQIQEVKARLSAVVDHALRDGPQHITRHGAPTAVILSEADYRRLAGRNDTSLVDFLAASPLGELELERDEGDTVREISF